MTPFDDDKLKEECGVFGITGLDDAAAHTALGLHALQHRGQEAAGIVTSDGKQLFAHRAMGLVGDNFNEPAIINQLKGPVAIGHVRYSTTGETLMRNVQPFYADFSFGHLAIAHNGNLTNAEGLRKELISRGSIFHSTSDTEALIHLIATSPAQGVENKIGEALSHVEGAYSLVILANDKLIGMRDAMGVRPLVLGKLGSAMILASESCALDIIGAELVRDVEPGEMIVIESDGSVTSHHPLPKKPTRFCIFEYVYFSRPDSLTEGKNIYETRQNIGRELAKESPVQADLVVPVPDSGIPAALGFAKESGIPFELGIIRNHYVGRTFIEPSDQVRHLGVKLKHNANRATIEGKDIVLVDDSIVRGTTSKKIVTMVREAGAKSVHMRIASPPTKYSCFYGVDTPDRDQLLAAKHDLEAMAKLINVDSLSFLSMDGLYRAVGEAGRDTASPQYCDACFTGEYPIRLVDKNEAGAEQQLPLLRETKR